MSDYDFRSLSSKDFEEVTRDLLQKEWGIQIESFKEGKDQGIDLRYSPLNNGDTIIQCKHYVGSGFKALIRDLKTKELPKVKLLSPSRYVLVTSVALTPYNKSEIYRIFSPFIRTSSDVIGQNDVNNLLQKHPNIETNHFKLWLTSKAVLERVLKNAILVQSDFKIEKITEKLPLYVQIASLQAAFRILENNHFLIISGIPGIGKTTLAEMLLYAYLEKGYAPIQVTENIKEAFDLYYQNQKQIFYYDDFLGQTLLHDRLGKNEDVAIIDFINLVRIHKNTRFVMTTREYILQSASLLYEKISMSDLETAKYILKLSDYSKMDKARMLYNHLYFSKLPRAYINELLNEKFYFEIIDHKNFSPRIIEWMTSLQYIEKVSLEEYPNFFKSTLDRPQKLWDHAFENQIEYASRILLLALYSLGSKSHIDVLSESFASLQRVFVNRYNIQANPKDFQFALKELEGTFTLTKQDSVEFHNASVKDFLELKLSKEPDYVALLLSSAVFFRQVITLWRLSSESQTSLKSPIQISVKKQPLVDALSRTIKTDAMVVESSGGVRYLIERDTKLVVKELFILEIFEKYKDPKLLDLLDQVSSVIVDLMINEQGEYILGFDSNEFKELINLLADIQEVDEAFRVKILLNLQPVLFAAIDKAYVLKDIINLQEAFDNCSSYWANDKSVFKQAFNRYLLNDFDDECSRIQQSYEFNELVQNLTTLENRYNIDASKEIEQTEDWAYEFDREEDRLVEEQLEAWREQAFSYEEEKESIEDMFDTLKES